MGNELRYGTSVFTDTEILGGEIRRAKSPITDELSYDTLDVQVFDRSGESTVLVDSLDSLLTDSLDSVLYSDDSFAPLLPFTRGTAGELYHDNAFIGKFYIESISRDSKKSYTLHFVSALGILDKIPCYGGMYTRELAKNIIAMILGGTKASEDADYEYYTGTIPYYLQKTLGNVPITGWLPYFQSSREALQQVLFAVGGSVLKTNNGVMKIAYWQPTEGIQLADDRVFLGGSINYLSKATQVVVTEHAFTETNYDKQTELYDTNDITVSHKLIIFNNPMHTLTTTNTLEIDEDEHGTQLCGSNYAYVSGMGTLVGYEYTHTKTTLSKTTGVSGDENTVTVTEAYLVSALNSVNVLERVSAYYGFADEVVYDFIVQGDVQEGDRVKFTDPFGDYTTAYLASEDINLSGMLKASATFIKNWQPNHVGNAYNNYTIITAEDLDEQGNWNVPQTLQGTPARVVIFGGFEGGQGGGNGGNGGNAYKDTEWSYMYHGGSGGAGGRGGTGGTTVNINTIDILSLNASYPVTLGVGGNGGAIGGNGSLGTDSTFNSVSTQGHPNTDGWANPIDGTVFGGKAEDGIKGGNGGGGGFAYAYNVISPSGRVDSYWECNGAGNGGNSGEYTGGLAVGYYRLGNYEVTGAGGGGACCEANGGNASKTDPSSPVCIAGVGASITTVLTQADIGHNGIGGSGGGGGGGGGFETIGESAVYYGNGSAGGTGQAGQKGSDGFILIMHN